MFGLFKKTGFFHRLLPLEWKQSVLLQWVTSLF